MLAEQLPIAFHITFAKSRRPARLRLGIDQFHVAQQLGLFFTAVGQVNGAWMVSEMLKPRQVPPASREIEKIAENHDDSRRGSTSRIGKEIEKGERFHLCEARHRPDVTRLPFRYIGLIPFIAIRGLRFEKPHEPSQSRFSS